MKFALHLFLLFTFVLIKILLPKDFSYNKTEKLKSKKQLDKVFEAGKSVTIFPLKLLYVLNEEQDNVVKSGVGVSSRNFKKAVQRNRIKRLMREAYRTEKQPLHVYLANSKKQLAIFLLYIDKEMPQYISLKEKMSAIIQKLIHVLNEMDIKNS